jgi:pseudouridine-5'-phosphate glycosidase
VHRGAEQSFDISADLQELAKTNVAVVCAGIKSVLDLGLTLEYLETNGVPVIGYQTKELPAFYSQKSGFEVDYRLDSAAEIASLIKTKWHINLKGGIVVANPIPEAYELDHYLMTKTINTAILEAEKNKIKGKDNTPFLLAKVKELTQGKSLDANIQLVYNNAKLAAEIAVNM